MIGTAEAADPVIAPVNSSRVELLLESLAIGVAGFGLGSALGWWPWSLLAVLLLGFVPTVVHEGGHLLASTLQGYALQALSVGPLTLRCRGAPGGLRWDWRGRLFGGEVVSFPRSGEALRRRELLLFAAGPLAELALAGIALALYALAHDGRWHPPNGAIPLLLLWLGTLALIGAAGNLWPFLPRSDGATLLLLARGGAEADQHCRALLRHGALLRLAEQAAAGVRPSDWDARCCPLAVGTADGSPSEALGAFQVYCWALDRGDIAAAGSYLDRCLAVPRARTLPLRWFHAAALPEAAYFTARFRRDARGARALLAACSVEYVPHQVLLRAEASILLAEGDAAGAETLCTTALALPRAGQGGATARTLLEELLAAARASRPRLAEDVDGAGGDESDSSQGGGALDHHQHLDPGGERQRVGGTEGGAGGE